MTTDDESFFSEVEEDYRREQAIGFLRRYGVYFLAAAFVIVAVVGGYTFDRQRRAEQAAVGGDAFTKALILDDAGKSEEAQKALEALAANGPGAYKVLARLQMAADSVQKKQYEAARREYRAVADDPAAPKGLRDFATMQAAALSIGTVPYKTLAAELDSYRTGTSAWRFSAKEILGLSAFSEGDTSDAERLFGEIVSDGGAPQGMRQRAEVLLALLLEKEKPAQADTTGKKDAANDTKTQ
jgi:hypothetical protein